MTYLAVCLAALLVGCFLDEEQADTLLVVTALALMAVWLFT